MPRAPIEYSKTIIYKIVCNDLTIVSCYVGKTTDFIRRKSQHKHNCNTENCKEYNYNVYKFIRENGGFNNWSMVMVQEFVDCKSELEASQRERYWYETLNANLNKNVPAQTNNESKKIWDQKNPEKRQVSNKKYREKNRDLINARRRETYLEKKLAQVENQFISEDNLNAETQSV